ncbi:MAG TPA: glycerophosphodiester phosphodiesterase [Gaiellaceae bacterium]|nr:glycerophosphodiester phosphodiesterase [Gaiellaceae bacterium]
MRLLRGEGPLIRVGHRGAPALAPENTLPSFEAALAHGVDAIEFDVLDLGTGPLAVAHSREEAGPGRPTLEEALDFLAGRDVGLHVDLKLTTRLEEVVDALDRHGVAERTVVSSFHLPSLRAVSACAPHVRIGFTYPEDRYGVSKRRALRPAVRLGTLALRRAVVARVPAMLARAGAEALMLQHAVVSAATVARAHAAGAAVWAWTVDDPVELARLEAVGVDAVITNDPRLFSVVATLPT